MLDIVNNDNKDFWELDQIESDIPGLSQAMKITLDLMVNKKRTISWIARSYWGVNYDTIRRRTQDISFIAALNEANKAVECISLERCREILSDIAEHDPSSNTRIKAIQTLISMAKTVTLSELAEVIGKTEVDRERAVEVLQRLGITAGDGEDD